MYRQKSLQKSLNRWIVLIALFLVLIGGGVSASLAFYQARELQDHTLLEIAQLVQTEKLNDSEALHHNIEEETIIINELGKKQHEPIIPLTIEDGLQTLNLDGSQWRVFITTQIKSGRRFSIAQQTELRDKIALSSGLSVFLPIFLLATILLLVIRYIIKKQFSSLALLASELDHQDAASPKQLDERDIPIEVIPFVHSTNGLLLRIKELLQKQHRFIADAAHEMRTPITALSLQLENLTKSTSDDERKIRLENLHTGLQRLSRLVTQLLDLARLQADTVTQKEKVSFNNIVQESIEFLFPVAEAANIDLGMVRQDDGIHIMDLQGRVSQLVYNAIDNAIHYSPPSTQVDISLFIQGDKAIFMVEDQGTGIPEEEIKEVLEPFYRVLGTNQSGNGLGLAISQEIAQHLGGEIILINRKGGGLCFRYEQALETL
ncbi:MAG: ATP-binding protein [Cocleimonas sp.]|nr:ATP-binding protein [Cocleimonas sp.]